MRINIRKLEIRIPGEKARPTAEALAPKLVQHLRERLAPAEAKPKPRESSHA